MLENGSIFTLNCRKKKTVGWEQEIKYSTVQLKSCGWVHNAVRHKRHIYKFYWEQTANKVKIIIICIIERVFSK